MYPHDLVLHLTRRHFLGRTCAGIGAAALASLLNPRSLAAAGLLGLPHFAPKARRVIYLDVHGEVLKDVLA